MSQVGPSPRVDWGRWKQRRLAQIRVAIGVAGIATFFLLIAIVPLFGGRLRPASLWPVAPMVAIVGFAVYTGLAVRELRRTPDRPR
jgi:hypothetical protein